MSSPLLRQKLDRHEFFFAPGCHDMMAALIAKKLGFEIVYGSGYWLTASTHGIPDAGIATYTQMVERMGALARISGAVVMADADTGYGGLLNVHHTVRGYEQAGVTAIQIEDQEFPKKCGHTPYKRIIPTADMVEKIKVACDARLDPVNTLIIGRTDARQSEGLDGAMRRAETYGKAGADIVFVEALMSEEEMAKVCREIDRPLMVNLANGGHTPILPLATIEELGFACAIFPGLTALAANHAVEHALRTLKEKGVGADPSVPLFDFNEFCRLIGFEEIWAFERKWGKDEGRAAE
ncbi:MAG TPA: isocitrate lyase/PEP mutase family protein [Stellaceae bacterium]